MGYNFLPVERDQLFLMPPSVADWLPEEHLAFFVLDAVDEMDLGPLLADYRRDGVGRAAHEPAMMTALLLYAYCVGVCSSRRIERACHFDVAFRVVTANQFPDHTTIARFRARHQQVLAKLFTESLALCATAGMTSVGLVAIDGTKMAADAAKRSNRSRDFIADQVDKMMAEAAAIDAEEDALHGPGNLGDEPPAELRGRADRRRRFAEAKARLEADKAEARADHEAHLARRAAKEQATGKPLRGRKPKPPAENDKPVANTTDPESRLMKTPGGYLQGYNAQVIVNPDQVIVAAAVTNEANDLHQLWPMIDQAAANLERVGAARIGAVLADAGYCTEDNLNRADDTSPELFVSSTKDYKRRRALRDQPDAVGAPDETATARAQMEHKLSTERGQALYRQRSGIVEPVFGQIKQARSIRQFLRRGLSATDGEWQLICATHNLLKLYRRALNEPTKAPWARMTLAKT